MAAKPHGGIGTILVVDDDDAVRQGAIRCLSAGLPGQRLLEAADGARALEILEAGGVDVLVTDMVMPGVSGLDLLRRVRSRPGRVTYVILMSGIWSPEQLHAAIDEGADDCVVKPLGWSELAMRVRSGLRRSIEERRREERAAELEMLYSRQSEFLSHVSHEIRTPLSAIISAANILIRYGAARPESVERFARVIQQEGQRLTRLINNLLDLVKIEAGQVEWRFEPTRLDILVEHVRESFEALVGERNLTLEIEPAATPVEVVLDADKITQVMVNLVANSIKHSPDGGTVRLRWLSTRDGGARIEIEDDGEGIPAGSEEKIFERFQQLDLDDARGGSGLGLTISRQIVATHGGRIWAEPNRPRGAHFIVELPFRPPQEGASDGAV